MFALSPVSNGSQVVGNGYGNIIETDTSYDPAMSCGTLVNIESQDEISSFYDIVFKEQNYNPKEVVYLNFEN